MKKLNAEKEKEALLKDIQRVNQWVASQPPIDYGDYIYVDIGEKLHKDEMTAQAQFRLRHY